MAIVSIVVYMIVGFTWPYVGFAKKNSPWAYDEEPVEGWYFKKFTK
jgi:hypothetical protein